MIDPLYAAWSGTFMERANRAHEDLRGALVGTVRRRTEGLTQAPLPEADTIPLNRPKVEPSPVAYDLDAYAARLLWREKRSPSPAPIR